MRQLCKTVKAVAARSPPSSLPKNRLFFRIGAVMHSAFSSVLFDKVRWLGLPKQADYRKAHQPQALVVAVGCVTTGVVLAPEIVRNTGSEQACARKLIARLAAWDRCRC